MTEEFIDLLHRVTTDTHFICDDMKRISGAFRITGNTQHAEWLISVAKELEENIKALNQGFSEAQNKALNDSKEALRDTIISVFGGLTIK